MEARIVVIDNDDSMRELFTRSSKREGLEVFAYAYGQIDLAALKQLGPDLIMLDFSHDGGIGWQFLQLLKMEDTTAKIPILITTTSHLSSEIQDDLLTRYISVVRKPFDLDTLIPLIQQILTQASEASVIFSGDPTLPILLVDDTDELRDTMATILRLEGFRVVTANNGLVALDSVSRADHCLILLDIAMPVMDGFEFLSAYDQQLRPHSPVIILSGESDIETQTLPAFVVDVLSKPFEFRLLLKQVGKYTVPV